jgi:hypothetical protein
LLDHAHNLPLQLAVEFGVPVAILFSGTALWAIYQGKPWHLVHTGPSEAPSPNSNRIFAWLLLLLIVGIHSMLEFPLWFAGFLFLAGLAIGYLLPAMASQPASHPHRPWLGIACASVLVGLMLVAWQQYAHVLLMGKAPFNDRPAQRAALKHGADAWLFRGHVDFAELLLTDVTPENAAVVRQKAEKLLHFSPEPHVIRPLLLSLWYLHDVDALRFYAARFCQKFPVAFEQWQADYASHPMWLAAGVEPASCRSTTAPSLAP